jgi:hypothetical protein
MLFQSVFHEASASFSASAMSANEYCSDNVSDEPYGLRLRTRLIEIRDKKEGGKELLISLFLISPSPYSLSLYLRHSVRSPMALNESRMSESEASSNRMSGEPYITTMNVTLNASPT